MLDLATEDPVLKAERPTISAQAREITRAPARTFDPSSIWMWILGAAALLAAAVILLLRYFPFSEKSVTESLRETFPSELTIDHFETVYFPHPGCKAQGVTFRSAGSAPGSTPIATIQTLTIQGSYSDLLWRPHHVSNVFLEGLRIHVPTLNDVGSFNGGYTDSKVTIGELLTRGAVLDFARSDGKPPVRFEIHELQLQDASAKGGMGYRVNMRNPTPPGEIKSTGHFGPFNAGEPHKTQISGSYSFEQADLSVFDGIAGIVSAEGKFSGPLGHVYVEGTTDTPDFEVLRSKHANRVSTRFQAWVNGVNGDVTLNNVKASYLNTEINATGSVAHKQGWDRKFTSLDFAVSGGHIQDILRIFVSEKRPPLDGITSFQAHVTVPPDGKPFLKEVTLQGDFDIGAGRFENPPRQQSVDELSQTARGIKKGKDIDTNENAAEHVTSQVHGHVDVKNGIANFTALAFSVPGADALMNGTFNMLNEKVNLHGNLRMDSKFSQSTSGIKALFAKVLDPFLNKKQGSVVPVLVDGTYNNPHFGLDLNPIKE